VRDGEVKSVTQICF